AESGISDPTFYTPQATLRGQHVAKMTELDDRGELDSNDMDLELHPYLDAWRWFKSRPNVVVLPDAIEMRVFHAGWRVAGTIDRLVVISGRRWIIDIKSGTRQRWHGVQLAGYCICLGQRLPRAALYLGSEGRPPRLV